MEQEFLKTMRLFSDTSTQSIDDKLKRVILHDLEHGKQEIIRHPAFEKYMTGIEIYQRDCHESDTHP